MTPTILDFVFEAGNLALDLANTRPLSNGRPVDHLATDDAADAWLAAAELTERGALLGSDAPTRAALLDGLKALRDSAAEVAMAVRDATQVDDAHLNRLNRVLATRTWSRHIVRGVGGFKTREIPTDLVPAACLVPIAEAAAALLGEVDPARVRQCDDASCVLWFVDTTRNGSRRWCSMERCGNRAKSAAHYRRAKRAPQGSAGRETN